MKPFLKPHVASSEDKAMPPTITLSGLCSEAADHVAKARLSLADEGNDADRALAHLDEAILCLRRLLAHGRAVVAKDARAASRLRRLQPERGFGP